jgi:hypothetical protein
MDCARSGKGAQAVCWLPEAQVKAFGDVACGERFTKLLRSLNCLDWRTLLRRPRRGVCLMRQPGIARVDVPRQSAS